MANLTDLEVLEVSLVAKPANRRRFLLFKSEEGESMKDIEKAEPSGERVFDDPIQAAELSAKATQAVKAALKILNEYRDELPDDVLAHLADLAGYGKAPTEGKAVRPYGYRYGYMPYGYREGYRKSENESEDTLKFDLSVVPEDLRPKMEALIKEREDAIRRASQLEEEKKLEGFISKAKTDYTHLSATPEEIGRLLKDISESLPSDATGFVERLLKSADKALEAALEPVGATAPDLGASGSWERIEKAAEGLMAEAGITRSAAIRKVLEARPELYREYLSEKEGQK